MTLRMPSPPPPIGFTREEVVVDGRRLSTLVGGDGPGLVLLHGWPQTSHSWRELLPGLAAQGYQVVAPDLHGTGDSEPASDGFGKDEQAAALRAVLRSLDVRPPIRVVGHDIGGMVAFAYARNYPEEVRRLVPMELLVPGLGLEAAMDVAHGGLFHFGFFMTPELPELLIDGHERTFFDWWFARMAADAAAFPPEQLGIITAAYTGRPALASGFGHYRTLLDDGRVNRAWVDGGGRLTMPVLAIGGELAAGARLGDSLAQVAPALRTEVVTGGGHFIPEERPDELLRLFVDFLTETPDDTAIGTRSPR
jgi:pimeloyl-ACP methyl ester carboxylesterase